MSTIQIVVKAIFILPLFVIPVFRNRCKFLSSLQERIKAKPLAARSVTLFLFGFLMLYLLTCLDGHLFDPEMIISTALVLLMTEHACSLCVLTLIRRSAFLRGLMMVVAVIFLVAFRSTMLPVVLLYLVLAGSLWPDMLAG